MTVFLNHDEIKSILDPAHSSRQRPSRTKELIFPIAEFACESCTGLGRALTFQPGFALILEDICAREDTLFELSEEAGQLAFTVWIQGLARSRFQGERVAHTLDGAKRMALCFTTNTMTSMEFARDHNTRCVTVRISASLLNSILQEPENELPIGLERFLTCDPHSPYWHMAPAATNVLETVNHILNCPYEGCLRHVYLECKAMELLTHYLASLAKPKDAPKTNFRLSSFDKERLYEARSIIEQSFSDPPALAALSRQIGLNRDKLTKGFRTLFNASIFEYCNACRLDHAKTLLKRGDSNITEVALSVGYAHSSSFARAFKRRFGFTPRSS